MSIQFVILRRLHSGGNGDLFIGRRNDGGEYVVIKYLREWHLAHARRAFAREVRVLERRLPGLMPVLFADTNAKHPHYVMPYLSGGSLTRYAGRLSDGQLHAIATELARTLAGLHAGHVTHGDVKPDNIMVSQDGRLQVGDPLGNGIGCTVLFSENHGGTPGYWAPEVCAGRPISHAGDAYSYGATLYHLLTGYRPRDGQRLDPISEGYVKASKIGEIVAVCCQSNPHVRPIMQEVLRMLRGEQWADIQATRKQHQELVTAACVVGVLVLLGAALTA